VELVEAPRHKRCLWPDVLACVGPISSITLGKVKPAAEWRGLAAWSRGPQPREAVCNIYLHRNVAAQEQVPSPVEPQCIYIYIYMYIHIHIH
jgi:hypothetical protein